MIVRGSPACRNTLPSPRSHHDLQGLSQALLRPSRALRRTPARTGMGLVPLLRTASSISSAVQQAGLQQDYWELDDDFSGLADADGMMTVAGFGSLLSERSARTTFPNLQNFRPAKVVGWRRVFAHTCDIFWKRGIANAATGEISSLSCEPHAGAAVVVALFEVPATPASVAAFIEREVEFRFVSVGPLTLEGAPTGRRAVLCAMNTDAEYRARRCPPEEWARRWAPHGIEQVWRDDVLPCRVYLRHCVLAATGFCDEARDSFLDATFLADRVTTVRQHLARDPAIMEQGPPPELVGRYSG